MKVLVTGGSGFVGKRLKLQKPDWLFLSSKHCNLLNYEETLNFLLKEKPEAVIHLAARVGGIKDNEENQGEFYYTNTVINTNVVHACYKSGVKRLLASLSTCVFPDKLSSYPFNEEDIFKGAPPLSNFSYAYSKRSLLVHINSYRKQYGLNYSCFCPSNIYGPGDNFENDKSHFVPAMIKKILSAEEGSTVEFWGTGNSLRQQLFVDDLAKIIPRLLENHNTEVPIIICPDENLSIKQMIDSCLSITNKKVIVKFNNELDGQYRKDGSNNNLKKLIGDFKFINFEFGIKKTIDWYLNYEKSL